MANLRFGLIAPCQKCGCVNKLNELKQNVNGKIPSTFIMTSFSCCRRSPECSRYNEKWTADKKDITSTTKRQPDKWRHTSFDYCNFITKYFVSTNFEYLRPSESDKELNDKLTCKIFMNPESVLDDEDCGDEEENSTENFDDDVANESVLKI